MTPEQFKKIRKGLINPKTGKAPTQTELAELLKGITGKGSRDLIRRIETGLIKIQKYTADAMLLLEHTGWPADIKQQFILGAFKTIESVNLVFEGCNHDDYVKELEDYLKQACSQLGQAIDLLKSNLRMSDTTECICSKCGRKNNDAQCFYCGTWHS